MQSPQTTHRLVGVKRTDEYLTLTCDVDGSSVVFQTGLPGRYYNGTTLRHWANDVDGDRNESTIDFHVLDKEGKRYLFSVYCDDLDRFLPLIRGERSTLRPEASR